MSGDRMNSELIDRLVPKGLSYVDLPLMLAENENAARGAVCTGMACVYGSAFLVR
jgi:hypothetical protein